MHSPLTPPLANAWTENKALQKRIADLESALETIHILAKAGELSAGRVIGVCEEVLGDEKVHKAKNQRS